MATFNREPLEVGEATMILRGDERKPVIVVTGEISIRNSISIIQPYLKNIHETMLHEKIATIVMDVTGLDFMNSNGISGFISWVMMLGDVEEERRYSIEVRYDSSISWQKYTFEVIVNLLPRFVSLRDVSVSA
jgi:hypothetical protein